MSRAATPTATTPARAPSPVNRLSPAAVQQAVDRLSRPRPTSPDPGPLLPPRPMSRSDIDVSVQRLYTQALNDKKNKMDRLERTLLVDRRPHKSMTVEDAQDSVGRLYYASVKRKQDKTLSLSKKYIYNFDKSVDPEARTKAEHSVKHLYEEEKERKAAREARLRQRYIEGTGPRAPRRSQSQIEEAVGRLTQAK